MKQSFSKNLKKTKQELEIKKITRQIVRNYKPEKIILFGSFAWGKPHKWSDVDLFIIKESQKRKIDRERGVKASFWL
ncbi:MAG: nucleotidyltransferase domain-containing protein [Minisyncoccales bacterium]